MIALLMAAGVAVANYDFRGAALGMSLAEFQALPPLSGDAGAGSCYEPPATAPDQELECTRAGDNPFPESTTLISYRFTAASGGAPHRLFRIQITGKTYNYPDALLGLRDRWGEPKDVVKGNVGNLLGATVEKVTFTWRRRYETVTATMPCGGMDTYCIDYVDVVGEAKAAEDARQAKNMGSRF